MATERQLTKWWTPEGEAGTLADQALKRRITPVEFAQMVLFLAAAAADGAATTAPARRHHGAAVPRRRRTVLTG